VVILPDSSALQVFYGTLPVIGAGVLGFWHGSKRLEDMRFSFNKWIDDLAMLFNKRIDDLAAAMNSGFSDVRAGISKLESRVSDVEKSSRFVR